MRYDTEHKQRTHEKVVQKAAEAIRQHGPDKIGVAALMAEVGLTHGGFYAHFKSKDDLIAEAIAHMFDERYEAFQKCLEGARPAEGLANYIDLYLSIRHLERRDKGCPVAALSGDVARMSAAARECFEIGVRRQTYAFAEVLKALGQPQPDVLAISVLTEMVGALVVARAMSSADIAERTLEAARYNIKRRIGVN